MPNKARDLREKVLRDHPGARIEARRVDGRAVRFDLGRGKKRLITTSRRLYLEDGTEIDDDLEAGSGSAAYQTKDDVMPYGLRVLPNGAYRFMPRHDPNEWIQIGRLRRRQGAAWVPVPFSPPGMTIQGDADFGDLVVEVRGHGVFYSLTVTDLADWVDMRHGYTTNGLTLHPDGRLTADSDGTEFMRLAPGKFMVKGRPDPGYFGELVPIVDATHITYSLPVLPADATAPVIVRL